MTTPPPPPPGYGPPPPGYGPTVPSSALASWGVRVGGALIDGLLVFGIIIVAVILGAILGNASGALGALVLVVGYLAGIAFAFYQLWVQGETGQTIGKKQLGIKLVRESDGQFVGGGLSIGRYFVHFLDSAVCGLGYLWPLWDVKRQTFADKILGTLVVKA